MSAEFDGRRVLVTGGTGFIGSFLVEELLRRGAHVRVPMRAKNYRALSARRAEIEWMEGDLRQAEFCRELVADVDFVFHLASQRRNVRYHHERCQEVFATNKAMSLALAAVLSDIPPIPVVFFSTGNIPEPCDVDAVSSQKTFDGYVIGKAACEELWLAEKKQRDFPLLIVRCVGIYGPRDTFSVEGNVIPSLMVKAQKSTDSLKVWGSGKQERSFLYVEDVIRALFLLIESGAQGVQPLSSSKSISVADLATQIRDLVNPELSITFDESQPEGIRSLPHLPGHPSLQKFPWTPLSEGLQKTWEWWNTKGTRAVRKKVEKLQGVG